MISTGLQIPGTLKCYQVTVCDGMEGLRMQAVAWMNEALFNLGFDEGWGWLDLTEKSMIISREKKLE